MSNTKRKRLSEENAPMFHEHLGKSKKFVRLYDDLITSEPFIELSPEAKLLFLYIKREYLGVYNKEKETVILPFDQIVKLTGIHRTRIRNRIDELVDYGFIEISQHWGDIRKINKYHFVSTWKTVSVKRVRWERDQRARLIKKAKKNAEDYKQKENPTSKNATETKQQRDPKRAMRKTVRGGRYISSTTVVPSDALPNSDGEIHETLVNEQLQ